MRRLHIVFCYKHPKSSNPNVSHVGLGVTAMNCAKFLLSRGIDSFVLPATKEQDLEDFLLANRQVTHVVVSALWIRTATFYKWCQMFPRIQFATNCHSNVAFLQHEPEAIRLLREGIELEELSTNFHIAGNNERFCEYIEWTYGGVCSYLPNMYFLNHLHRGHAHTPWSGGTLKIGIFGALRALKNFNTATAAAIYISKQLKTPTEIWINVARQDSSDANVVLRAIRNATQGVPNVKLVEFPWASWPDFRRVIGSMNLLLQPSFTETFNGVSADGCAMGVPSVVSSAIAWAPDRWKADVDDAVDIGRVGIGLLLDKRAVADGLEALHNHNEESFQAWMNYAAWRPLPSRGGEGGYFALGGAADGET